MRKDHARVAHDLVRQRQRAFGGIGSEQGYSRRFKSANHCSEPGPSRRIARRRAPVEAVFSAMKCLYGKARARCYSLARNAADYFSFLTVFDLTRVVTRCNWLHRPKRHTPQCSFHAIRRPTHRHPHLKPRETKFRGESTRRERGRAETRYSDLSKAPMISRMTQINRQFGEQ